MAGNSEGVLFNEGRARGGDEASASSCIAPPAEKLFVLLAEPRTDRLFAGRADGDSGSIEEDEEEADLFNGLRERNGGEDAGMASAFLGDIRVRVARTGDDDNGGVAILEFQDLEEKLETYQEKRF